MFERAAAENYFQRLGGALGLVLRSRLIFFGCVMVLLIPFPTTVVPEWRLRLVDEQGKPRAGVQVTQVWKHYSLEWGGCCDNEEERWTDGNGFVVFPRRTIWAGLLRRIVFPIWARVLTLAHGGSGIHAYVMVIDGGGARLLICNSGQACVPFAGKL
jgi:hypothetical protein